MIRLIDYVEDNVAMKIVYSRNFPNGIHKVIPNSWKKEFVVIQQEHNTLDTPLMILDMESLQLKTLVYLKVTNEKDKSKKKLYNFSIMNIAFDEMYLNQAIVMILEDQTRTITKIPFFSIDKEDEFQIPPISNWKFTLRNNTTFRPSGSLDCHDGKVFVWDSNSSIAIFDFQCGELLGILDLKVSRIPKFFRIFGDKLIIKSSEEKLVIFHLKFASTERFYNEKNSIIGSPKYLEIMKHWEVLLISSPMFGEVKDQLKFAITEYDHIYDLYNRSKLKLDGVRGLFHFEPSRMELFAHSQSAIYIIQDKEEMEKRKRLLFMRNLFKNVENLTDLKIIVE